MNLGIDLGRTIISREEGNTPFPNAFDVIAGLVKKMANTYIVSRVDSEQKIRAIKWLDDHDFYNKTGIKQTDVYYCFDRKDKAIFVRGLGIDAFIDDRPDVLMCMDNKVDKILFNPYAGDMETYKNDIEINNMLIVRDWNRIGEYFGVIKK